MSLLTIQSASSIDTKGATTIEIAGVVPIQTVTGMADGQTLLVYSTDYLPLKTGGNINFVTTTFTPGRPMQFLMRNGVLYEITPVFVKEVPAVNLFAGDVGYYDGNPWCGDVSF